MQSVFPTAYFGNIFYFYALVHAEKAIIEIHEHFVKQTIRTRCEILSANGPIHLSIPVSKPNGSKTLVKNIQICNKTNWKANHWRAIQSAYASAPFFDHYGSEVYQLIFSDHQFLYTFNESITNVLLNWLDIEFPISFTNEYSEFSNQKDFRLNNFERTEVPIPSYNQVFATKQNFFPNLSLLDLIMNEGPLARNWIFPN